ncbi:hypothetical protein NPS46_17705 [Pseudomonas putida]|uniref:hypothetical protein n=1 Tax=Pseudomonas putida TaxID=303 RepID=UPI002363B13C|nr:hypothetical protein [Pseudomonas putida]MDD2054383.1 hypothetical protein [Pseudomonas putida]
MESQPWLKAMQNGELGEARARAFLLDRFWVLERSVDIEGADLIIQRRLMGRSLFDRRAPALGVVQVKFFAHSSTTHYVSQAYVVGEDNKPRLEFFLLCMSGDEDSPAVHLVTGVEIFESFDLVDVNGALKYRVSYRYLKSRKDLLVANKRLALNRMESILQQVDFDRNRQFVSWALPPVVEVSNAIVPVFLEPIDNWWGDIPSGFRELKGKACSALDVIEEVHGKLVQIMVEGDPLIAEKIVRDIEFECGGYGRGWAIPLPDDLCSDDFFQACRIHRVMVDALRRDGLLDSFVGFRARLKRIFVEFLEGKIPLGPNVVCVIDIKYSLVNFGVNSCKVRLEDVCEYFGLAFELNKYGHVPISGNRYSGIDKLTDSRVQMYIVAGRYSLSDVEGQDLYEKYSNAEFSIYTECMDGLFALKYGDPYSLAC